MISYQICVHKFIVENESGQNLTLLITLNLLCTTFGAHRVWLEVNKSQNESVRSEVSHLAVKLDEPDK